MRGGIARHNQHMERALLNHPQRNGTANAAQSSDNEIHALRQRDTCSPSDQAVVDAAE